MRRSWKLSIGLFTMLLLGSAAFGQSPVAEKIDSNGLVQQLRTLHAKLASSQASSLAISGSCAVRFDEARAETANYIRTAVAAVQIVDDTPDLLNCYHAAVALTGLQYDLNGLLLAANMTDARRAKEWSASTRALVNEVNRGGNKLYATCEARLAKADLTLKQAK